MSTASKKIDSLQALRAFAALSVMFFHGSEVLSEKIGYSFLNNTFMAGFSGVQLFFVLSGFIIFYTSYSKNLTTKEFLLKRIIRIYPVHTLIISAMVIMYFISPSPDQVQRGEPRAIISSLTLIPFGEMVLGPSWTLCFEMMFYVIFAFTYLKSKRLFIIALICWVILILTGNIFKFQTKLGFINNMFDLMNFNFIFGCLIAWLYIVRPDIKYAKWLILPALLLFFTFWTLEVKEVLPNTPAIRLLCFGIPSALVVLALLYNTFKVPKALVFLGDASFSLYLLHFPMVRVLLKIFLKLKIDNYAGNLLMSLIMFLTIVIISSLFYYFVERNISRYFNNKIKKKVSYGIS